MKRCQKLILFYSSTNSPFYGKSKIILIQIQIQQRFKIHKVQENSLVI